MNFNHFLDRIDDINLSLDQKKRLFDVINNVVKDNIPEQKDDFKQFILQNFGKPVYINFERIIGVNNDTGVLYKNSNKTISVQEYGKEKVNYTINVEGNTNKNKWIFIGNVSGMYGKFIKYKGSITQKQEITFRNVFGRTWEGFAEYSPNSPIKLGDTLLVNGKITNGENYFSFNNCIKLGEDLVITNVNNALILKNPCYIETE
jgi:hypothetical protein